MDKNYGILSVSVEPKTKVIRDSRHKGGFKKVDYINKIYHVTPDKMDIMHNSGEFMPLDSEYSTNTYEVVFPEVKTTKLDHIKSAWRLISCLAPAVIALAILVITWVAIMYVILKAIFGGM